MTSQKAIPFYCPGGKKIYFKREELSKWITSGKVESDVNLLDNVSAYLNRAKTIQP